MIIAEFSYPTTQESKYNDFSKILSYNMPTNCSSEKLLNTVTILISVVTGIISYLIFY